MLKIFILWSVEWVGLFSGGPAAQLGEIRLAHTHWSRRIRVSCWAAEAGRGSCHPKLESLPATSLFTTLCPPSSTPFLARFHGRRKFTRTEQAAASSSVNSGVSRNWVAHSSRIPQHMSGKRQERILPICINAVVAGIPPHLSTTICHPSKT